MNKVINPSTGFKIESAKRRGLVDNPMLYKIGLIIEGFFYCTESLTLPPTTIKVKSIREELLDYNINIDTKTLVNYLKKLGEIKYIKNEDDLHIQVPMFAIFGISMEDEQLRVTLVYNPYF